MNLLMWNYRGFRNLQTGRELGDIIRAKDLSIMFIAETWADEARLEIIQRNSDFKDKWLVPKEGCGGGIALFLESLGQPSSGGLIKLLH